MLPTLLRHADAGHQAFTDQLVDQLMMRSSWSGRLPSPRDLRAYDEVVPGSARELVDELLHESKLAQQAIDIDRETAARLLTLWEQQEDRTLQESRSDRDVRDRMLKRVIPLLYVPAVLFLTVLFVPLSDVVTMTALIVLAALYLIPLSMVILRGRVSDNERDAMKIVPEVTQAVMASLQQREQHSRDQVSTNGPEDHNER